MTGTGFLRTAYHKSMDILIVLLILALSDSNPELKRRLRETLAFYRENRELLTALAGASAATADTEDCKQKNSPETEGEKLRVLEDFLKRL